jgi:hypothetical protein
LAEDAHRFEGEKIDEAIMEIRLAPGESLFTSNLAQYAGLKMRPAFRSPFRGLGHWLDGVAI